jgi:hypothetical protein
MDKPFKKLNGSDKDLHKDVKELRRHMETSSKNINQAFKQIKATQNEHGNRLDKIEADLKEIQSTQANHGDLLKQIVQLLKNEVPNQ